MMESSQKDIKSLSVEEQAFVKSLDAGSIRDAAVRLLVDAFKRGMREGEERSRAEIATLKNEIVSLKKPGPTFVRPTSAGAVGRLPNEIVHSIFMLLVHEGRALKEVLREHIDFNVNKRFPAQQRVDMLIFAETCSQWRAVVQAYRAKYLSIPPLHPELVIDSETSRTIEHLHFRNKLQKPLLQADIDKLLAAMAVFLHTHGGLVSHLSLGGGCPALVGFLADMLPGGRAQLKSLNLDHGLVNDADTKDTVVAAIPTLASLRDFSLQTIGPLSAATPATGPYSFKVLSALATLPHLASVDIAEYGSNNPPPIAAIPAFASHHLRQLQLNTIPGLSLDAALNFASSFAATLELLLLHLSPVIGAVVAPSSPPIQYPKLKTANISMFSPVAVVWTEVPLLAGVLEQSPALEDLSLSSASFNDAGRGRVSPTQRFKDKISNGVVKKVGLGGSRREQPPEFLHFIDNEWPSSVEIVNAMSAGA